MFGISDIAETVVMRKDRFIKRFISNNSTLCEFVCHVWKFVVKLIFITSPEGVVAKHCDVCLCVVYLSARISPEPHARFLPIFVHVSYVRGSVLLRHVDDRPHRLSAGRGNGRPSGVHSVGEV